MQYAIATMPSKHIMISGIQPTGNLHIGNYLGAVKNWVDLQNSGKYELSIFIADLHSITGNLDADTRRENIITIAAELIAAGIDPEQTTLFAQSHVTGHTELAWVFNCVTPIAELERMTQFKDKSERQQANINVGLFDYPVLQAADILLYRGTHVPVGEDQVQHVELTRDIARWFNNRFGNYFPECEAVLTETPRIKSLLEPTKKMSKSAGAGHVIELADDPEMIEKKIKKAVTATEGGEHSPGVENLLLLLQHFGDARLHAQFVEEEQAGTIRYGDLKGSVATAVSETFAEFRNKRAALLSDRDAIADILAAGAQKAQMDADETMARVRELVGIR